MKIKINPMTKKKTKKNPKMQIKNQNQAMTKKNLQVEKVHLIVKKKKSKKKWNIQIQK